METTPSSSSVTVYFFNNSSPSSCRRRVRSKNRTNDVATDRHRAAESFRHANEIFSSNDPFASSARRRATRHRRCRQAPVAATIETRRHKGKIFEKLMKQKLCNAGCVAMDLSFDEVGRATLEDASLIFGSRFV